MKIKSLYIENYKNINAEQFDIDSNNRLIALIGENGSGKSNLLEAISTLFNDIYNIKPCNFDYIIEYEINNDQISITREKGNIYFKINNEPLMPTDVKKQYLPTRIIANYSGEDLRLFYNYYKPSYDLYNKQLKNNETEPDLSMIYINKYYWSLCLLSLLYIDYDVYPDIADFCKKQLGIISIKKVLFTLDLGIAKKWKDNAPRQLLQSIFDVDNLSSLSNETISLTIDELKERTYFLYGRDIDFFLFLFSAYTVKDFKLLTDISFEIESDNGAVIGVRDFSEGEKKLILIECITKVLGDENTLILLDEPDAHVHISRKKDMLNTISEFDGQIILTTHSPVFAEMLKDEWMRYMIKGKAFDMSIPKVISNLSDGLIGVMEGAVVSFSPLLIVTEGTGDIAHLKEAIDIFAKKDPKYKLLKSIPLVWQGGAKQGEKFCESVIRPNYNCYKIVVFVFDYDGEGREGAKIIHNQYLNKLHTLFYHEKYPIENSAEDFYLEDFYPSSVYSIIKMPKVDGVPKYHQMKLFDKLHSNVKKKIAEQLNKKLIKEEEFDNFKPFLNELLEIFNAATSSEII